MLISACTTITSSPFLGFIIFLQIRMEIFRDVLREVLKGTTIEVENELGSLYYIQAYKATSKQFKMEKYIPAWNAWESYSFETQIRHLLKV